MFEEIERGERVVLKRSAGSPTVQQVDVERK